MTCDVTRLGKRPSSKILKRPSSKSSVDNPHAIRDPPSVTYW